MAGDTDAVLIRQTQVTNDHILVDLPLKTNLVGRLTGVAAFTRSTTGTFVDNTVVKTAAINTPRFEANGILMEGAITPLFIRSEEFDQSPWAITASRSKINANATAAPDNATTADEYEVLLGGENSINQSGAAITAGATLTFDLYFKNTSASFIHFTIGNGGFSNGFRQWYNPSTKAFGTVIAFGSGWSVISTSQEAAANGFTRLIIIVATAVDTAARMRFSISNSDGVTSGTIGQKAFIWGHGPEQLSFASSYIPTAGTAVPRGADDLSIDAANIPAPTADYTVCITVDSLGFDSSKSQVLFNIDGETSRRIQWNTTTGAIEAIHGAVTSISTSTFSAGDSVEICFTVGGSNQTLYINSVQEDQDVKGTVTGTATAVDIGHQAGANQAFSNIQDLKIFDIQLSASQVVDKSLVTETIIIPGTFDISFDADGDILTDDFFDTSILYSIFGERRADPSEVVEPQLRRGWIGNEGKDFENGSKLWLFEQARLTQSNLNRIEDEIRKGLQWLVDDGFATSVDEVISFIQNNRALLESIIRRSRSQVERRFFTLWQNTGLR